MNKKVQSCETNTPKISLFSAFTIVELLIVIAIIGILAAITIVSYKGITGRANELTLQVDLANAKKQFLAYKIDHRAYPTSLEAGTNCLKGTTLPSPDTRYCLKSSGGSVFELTDATGSDYTLTLTKGTVAYKITKDTPPTPTTTTLVAASFARSWGGSAGDSIGNITTTSDGGYVVAGYTASFGAGSNDAYLAKYDSSDTMTWNKTWGGTGNEYGNDAVQTDDGGYILIGSTTSFGSGSSDIFLAKYDTSGNLSWNKTWGGTSTESSSSIVKASDGGYLLAGNTSSFAAGFDDVLLLKYDSSGNLSWNKTWGGTNGDVAKKVIKTSDNGYAITGETTSFGSGITDVLTLKYDSSGNLSWNKTWGGSASTEQSYGIVQASDGGYVITGSTASFGAGGTDAFLAKYDASGNLSWSKTWGGASSDRSSSIIKTNDNNYAIVGTTSSFGAGGNDGFFSKYDLSGNLLWNKTWGESSSDTLSSLIQNIDGSYLVSGYSYNYNLGDNLFLKFKADGSMNNCTSPMCQSATATITSPTATVTTPAATIMTPSATVASPTATVTTPSAAINTIVAP